MRTLRHFLFLLPCLSAMTASATNRQFNTFTPASSQPPKVNPAVQTIESCATCTPPTHAEWLLERGCPSCPSSKLPPPLQPDCHDCGTEGPRMPPYGTEPFTTVVDTCADCDPFELHPHVGWNVETDISGTGVDLRNGNLFHRATDLDVPGRGFSFRFVRRHVSGISYDGPLGHNWDFNYNMRIVVDGNGHAAYHDGTGRQDVFQLSGGVFQTPAGRFEELTKSGSPADFFLTKPNGTVYEFEYASGRNWRLETITDRAGNVMSFAYDATWGRLDTVTDTRGKVMTFAYDGNGRITTLTDFDSRVWHYAYTSGALKGVSTSSISSPIAGFTTSYGYDGSHRLNKITDPESQIVLEAVYTSGKVTELDYGGSTHDFEFVYNSSTQTTVTDRVGNERVVTLTANGQPDTVTENTNRNVRSGEGDYTTDYTYNADLLITDIELPDGNALKYVHATGAARARSNILEERHINDGASADDYAKWTYDATTNLVKTYKEPRDEQAPGDYTVTYYYDHDEASGDLNGDGVTTGTDGVLVKKSYPTVTSQSPNITPTERFRYNSHGQLTWWEHPDGEITTFTYHASGDGLGFLDERIEDPGGLDLTTAWTYDSAGNISRITDGRGHHTTYDVSPHNRLLSVVAPISSTVDFETKYEYDDNGNRTKTEIENLDGDGSAYANGWITTQWTHEILNRVASRIDEVQASGSPTTVTTSFTYDKNRNLEDTTRPEGNVTRLIYDERDLRYERIRDYGTTNVTERWSWTPNRLLLTYRTAVGSHTTMYGYDEFDRQTSVTDPEGNLLSRTFDTAGHIVTEDLGGVNK